MKHIFHIALRIISGFLFVFVACIWAWSYHAPHSLKYSRACGEIRVLADRGIFQVDLVCGDTEDRGFAWDDYRRSASWGRTTLDTFKPKAGFGHFLAKFGFASWSYSRHLNGFLSPGLPGRVVFLPLWLLALVAILPALIELVVILTSRWSNKSLQATRDGGLSSASRFTLVGPACLSSGR